MAGEELHEFAGHAVSDELSERIRDILSAAEAAAGAVRHEAEQHAQARRRAAEEEARRLIEHARRDAEALLAERIRRISELSDTILERGEDLLTQLDHAEEIKRELSKVARALGETAGRLAREATTSLEAPPAAPRPRGDDQQVATPETPPVAPETATAEPEAAPAEPEAATAEPEAVPAAAEPAPAAAERPPGLEAEPAEQEKRATESSARGLSRLRRAVLGAEPAAPEPEPPSAPPEPPKPAPRSDAPDDDELLGARLVALQMAVAGGNRGEVADHLRRSFAITNVDLILDDVFGSGSDSSKRVVWPSTADA